LDKAEYKIATEHIKKLISQGEYAEASYIADTIDWRRVKSVMMLCTVSDLYKVNRRYQDAKELLYMAYERNPESRTILYSLCDLSIKLEEFVAAIEYYKSFVEVAPKDTGRYVLQYRLYQAQDVGLEERIEVLEQLKSEEYIEKWAYELAYLYHRIGFATKCVEECDELILWFGKGRYVYKAMELKMLHEPLTPYQQQVYDHRFDHMEQAKDMTRVLPRIDSGDSAMTEEGLVDVTDAPTVEIPQDYLEKELEHAVEIPIVKADDIQVKTLDVANAYNTMNLQKELADSLREILEVSHTESSVDVSEQQEETGSMYADTAEITEAKDTTGIAEGTEIIEKEEFSEAASQEPEPQTVQETPLWALSQPVLAQTAEKPEKETDEALEAAGKALEVISEQISIQQILPDAFRFMEQEPVMVDEQITGQLSIEDVLAEWSKQEEKAQEAHQEEISARIKNQTQDIFAAIEAEMQKDILDNLDFGGDVETAEAVAEEPVEEEISEVDVAVVSEPEIAVQEPIEAEAAEEGIEEQEALTDAVAEVTVKELETVKEMETVKEPETGNEPEVVQQEQEPQPSAEPISTAESVVPLKNKNLYKAFIRSEETETQISTALEAASMKAAEGNVRVTGHDLSVCFELIKTMMADLKERGFMLNGKTAKISAVNLNKKEPSEIISKVQEGALIIERAGRLRKEAVEKLQQYLYTEQLSVLVFMTDTEQGMKHFVEKYPVMGELFPYHINIKDYSEDELVEYAVKYAYQCEYSIEEMGQLALRTRIEQMVANDKAPTMAEARNIVDDAIDRANRKNMKHFMDVLFHKRYDAEDMIILREEDFLYN